jgi:hypothetical protein
MVELHSAIGMPVKGGQLAWTGWLIASQTGGSATIGS